jgi:hypothetical protein
MTDQQKQLAVAPRIDEHGVGWCSTSCPSYQRFFDSEVGYDSRCEMIKVAGPSGVCVWWARAAARDHAKMTRMRGILKER